jgi:DNA-binding CsgD family transcriptional regulator
MEHLVLLYDIICYTVGGIGLVFAALTAALTKSRIDRRYAAFMASFTLILVGESMFVYARNAAVGGNAFISVALNLETVGGALMIAVLPRFVHSFSKVPIERALNIGFTGLGIATLCFGVLWVQGVIRGRVGGIYFFLIFATIVYSLTTGNLFSRLWPPRDNPPAETVRWDRIMGAVTILTVSFIPFLALIDFFPQLLPAVTRRLPSYFRTAPLFFLIWNLIYIFSTIPIYRKSKSGGSAEWDFDRFNLSPREQEVAGLLLEGFSYREIAAKLSVSFATVKTHVNRIYDKTGAGNKIELSRMLHAPPADTPPSIGPAAPGDTPAL